ncbi:tyrosine-protein phosphatase [Deminuibacter soli]|uniref:protein-tyrosine-phosphatase n=1 Tax=Deminuibacter soli TaxID=2291815 RepID=A0A3E1NNI7_9BACT|nr:CpsB/CapC family capsule biosynthesis tyrosine phosphatase [Deminuibacter soli]RFM29483.1 capsular biosynthesis protein [Deminuibacter soli]
MFKLFSSASRTSRNEVLPKDFSFLKTDIHSHLIPGIDDGSPDVAESIVLIKHMQRLGFSRIVTTPHIKWERYPNTRETITAGLQQLQAGMAAEQINFEVRAAAEYYLDDHFFSLLDKQEPLLTIDENKVLVEFSFYAEPFQPHDTFFRIQTAGYQPVLAHPERYGYFHERKEMYKTLKNAGAMLQLNLLALTGYYGKKAQQVSEWMLKEGLYDFCGTDMHHTKHAEGLKDLISSRQLQLLQQYPSFRNAGLGGTQ